MLLEQQLFARASKCLFYQEHITYLGYILSAAGVEADPEKVTAIIQWPVPQNLNELQVFLRMAIQMRSFVDGYAHIVAPLMDYTCKEARFPLGEAAVHAFDRIKVAIAASTVMALPDPAKPFIVRTDASNVATGAVLQQEGKNVAFLSRKMQGVERNYLVHDQELLAVVQALKTWRHYLYGADFTVVTNHKALTHFFSQPMLNPHQRRWLSSYLSSPLLSSMH